MLKKDIVTFTYEITMDSDTGNIVEMKLMDTNHITCTDNDPDPKLFLEENKCRINNAAIKFMGLDKSSKLIIKYETINNQSVPIIGTSVAFNINGGSKLSKTNTISCRGINHELLEKYGKEFDIIKHPTKENLFQLVSKDQNIQDTTIKDEKVKDFPFNLDIDVATFDDNEDDEINPSFFKF